MPEDAIKDFMLIQPDAGAPNLSPDLEQKIGDAVTKLFDPKLAIITGELEQYERICLSALYMRAIKLYPENAKNNLYSRYIYDYVLRTVPFKRKRAGEAVDVLKNLVSYANLKVREGIRTKLGL
jgi:hypothetical protein